MIAVLPSDIEYECYDGRNKEKYDWKHKILQIEWCCIRTIKYHYRSDDIDEELPDARLLYLEILPCYIAEKYHEVEWDKLREDGEKYSHRKSISMVNLSYKASNNFLHLS
jgi:hypothetical protein